MMKYLKLIVCMSFLVACNQKKTCGGHCKSSGCEVNKTIGNDSIKQNNDSLAQKKDSTAFCPDMLTPKK